MFWINLIFVFSLSLFLCPPFIVPPVSSPHPLSPSFFIRHFIIAHLFEKASVWGLRRPDSIVIRERDRQRHTARSPNKRTLARVTTALPRQRVLGNRHSWLWLSSNYACSWCCSPMNRSSTVFTKPKSASMEECLCTCLSQRSEALFLHVWSLRVWSRPGASLGRWQGEKVCVQGKKQSKYQKWKACICLSIWFFFLAICYLL